MYDVLDRTEANCIALRISGRLTTDDFERLRPYLKKCARAYNGLYVLFLMDDWHGWDSFSALWEDLKTDVLLNDDVERLAMVGETDWERWATRLTEPFARGDVRFFNRSELDVAWDWITTSAERPA
jgi:hypothetical protein